MIWHTIKQTLGRVPWQAWAVLALLAAFQVHGCTQYRSGYSDGRESVLSELRKAEAAAADRSMQAAAKGDKSKAVAAERSAQIIAGQIARVEAAETKGESALDALFGW